MYIGNKLHALRKAKKISLTELSQQSGVQLATLSRIENMKMVGTLESHINIAKALGLDVTELYRDIDKQPTVMDAGEARTDIFTHSEHSSCELLTKNVLQKKMMPALVRINPKGKTKPEKNQAGSEKFIFVLEGSIEADIQGQKFALNKSNTLYFDASLPHTFTNTGKSAARALCVCTPVSL
ncbi:MAG: helix-turn-helix transcriptional regulator [Candidatus Omnitrophica bacterium]|nr:helix-turn-helix transcriptional regulator [Candidatus Omnitrophota bacterium]